MKKILALACLLALVAVLAVPMAATAADPGTPVGGTVKFATVTMTAPSAIAFGTFKMGYNTKSSLTPGKVTVVRGTSGAANWTVTTSATSPYMGNATDNLDSYLLIGASDGVWFIANGGVGSVDGNPYSGALSYAGDAGTGLPGTIGLGSVPFFATQFIKSSDSIVAGTYSVSVTFTAACLP